MNFKLAVIGLFVACSHTPNSPSAQLGPLPPMRNGMVERAEQPLPQHILFSGAVDSESVSDFTEMLNRFIKSGAKTIVVEINTPGGSVGAGFAMGQAIERSSVPVVCVVDGMAASMGLYILQSCDVRIMTKRSLLMGHEPAGGGRGQPQEIQQTAELLIKLSRAMAHHITAKTKLSTDDYLAKISGGKELWLTVEDAIAFAFVDFSVDTVDEAKAATR